MAAVDRTAADAEGPDQALPCSPNVQGPAAAARFAMSAYPVNDHVHGVEALDVDGDGDLEILGAAGGLVVLRNDGAGKFTLLGQRIGTLADQDLQVIDYDSDGRLDVVGPDFEFLQPHVVFYRNLGGGMFQETGLTFGGTLEYLTDVGLGDLDGDGIADVISGSHGLFRSQWYLSDKNGGYRAYRPHWSPASAPGRVADLDADGLPDLVLGCSVSGYSILYNSPGFEWGDVTDTDLVCAGTPISLPIVADADKDGRLDIWGLSYPSFAVLHQVARRVFVGRAQCVPFFPRYFTLGDLDGNGYPDAILGAPAQGRLLVVLNPGRDRPAVARLVDVGGKSSGPLVARDFDKDGRVDIAVSTFPNDSYLGNSKIVFLRNLGGW